MRASGCSALAVLVALVAGCHEHRASPEPGSAALGSSSHATGSSGSATSDPWSGPRAPSDVPDLAERRALVDEACPAVTGPYFFQLDKAGKTSYLLGTRHLSVALSEFPPVVTERLRGAQLVVFEIDPADKSHGSETTVQLREQLGPELWKRLVKIVGEGNAAALANAKPAEAMITMMALYEDPTRQLEADIEHVATDKDIKMRGLETSQFQDELLDKLLDLRMLRAALASTPDRHELADETVRDLRSYCSGAESSPGMDARTRKQLVAAGYTAAEIDAVDEQIVYARNRRWIPQLEQLFAGGGVFVAVGADHLLGDRGVVHLLEQRGFKAKRVTR